MATATAPVGNIDFIPPVTTVGKDNNVNTETDSVNQIIDFANFLSDQNSQALTALDKIQTQPSSAQDNIRLLDESLLNLSPQALNALNGVNGTVNITDGFTSIGSAGALLSIEQIQQLTGILAQFGTAAYNQAAYTQMQNALMMGGVTAVPAPLQAMVQESSMFMPFSLINGEIITNLDVSEFAEAA